MIINNIWKLIIVTPLALALIRCTTKAELRREQELAEIKKEVKTITGSKADMEVAVEELRFEISRLNGLFSEREQFQTQQFELLKKEIDGLVKRIQNIEESLIQKRSTEAEESPPAKPITYDAAEGLYKAGKYEEAVEILNALLTKNPNHDKAHFLLAESLFSLKEFGNAAIELNKFRKKFPKHTLISKAIYYQATCFKKLNKKKEANLFYQELLDKYPKSSFAKLAKKEMKQTK